MSRGRLSHATCFVQGQASRRQEPGRQCSASEQRFVDGPRSSLGLGDLTATGEPSPVESSSGSTDSGSQDELEVRPTRPWIRLADSPHRRHPSRPRTKSETSIERLAAGIPAKGIGRSTQVRDSRPPPSMRGFASIAQVAAARPVQPSLGLMSNADPTKSWPFDGLGAASGPGQPRARDKRSSHIMDAPESDALSATGPRPSSGGPRHDQSPPLLAHKDVVNVFPEPASPPEPSTGKRKGDSRTFKSRWSSFRASTVVV